MGVREPGSNQGCNQGCSQEVTKKNKTLAHSFSVIATSSLILSLYSAQNAMAAKWAGLEITQGHFNNIINSAMNGTDSNSPTSFQSLVARAEQALTGDNTLSKDFQGMFGDGSTNFKAERAIGDNFSTTIKFAQTYKGLEVVGNEAMVHFDRNGDLHDVSGKAIDTAISAEPKVSLQDAYKILADRYQQNVKLSEPAKLKVLRDFDGKTHLVYHMLTKTTATHDGQEVFLDAQNGEVVLETDRAYDASKGSRTVYSADTDKAHEHVDGRGYPTDIDLSWYDKVIEDGERTDKADRSALNAYRSSGLVYEYYKTNFNRRSFDDQDSRIVNVVHMGEKMNNAFWTNEYKLMAYGDGDGEHLTDLTYGLDVAAHELTHGVTASTAKLVYAAESGALNESYSDFFGKMVDYNEGNWDIGAKIMAPKWNRRALRNMKNPEEFKQPGSNDSPLKIPTTGPCTRANDRCGVHTNSGIPSHAAVMIVEGIGKEKAEQLYYKVLTTRLTATSDFKAARQETEKACGMMFGEDSSECRVVTKAYDTVGM